MRVSAYTVLADITDKVKDSIGTTVGLDHALSYTTYDDCLDDWYYDQETDADKYYSGEWVDHDGSAMPVWVDPDDIIEAYGSLSLNTRPANWFMWSQVTKYRLKD
jgi:hypothetical protein